MSDPIDTAVLRAVEAAITTVEFSRQTHVQWRDWLRANPDDQRGPTVGDAEYQQRCVSEYDNVLSVLRTLLARLSTTDGES